MIENLKDIKAGKCYRIKASWWMTIIEGAFPHKFWKAGPSMLLSFEQTNTYFLHSREFICDGSNDNEWFRRLGFRQFNHVTAHEYHHRLCNNEYPVKPTTLFRIDVGNDGVIWTAMYFNGDIETLVNKEVLR